MKFYDKRRPKDGEIRLITKFLWFPKCLDGETRWLETATWEEKYSLSGHFKDDGWYATRWINENE